MLRKYYICHTTRVYLNIFFYSFFFYHNNFLSYDNKSGKLMKIPIDPYLMQNSRYLFFARY
jgi:hypothetical protein